jgi:hypothetical protein
VRTNDLNTSDAYDAASPNFWTYDPQYLTPPEDDNENSSLYYEPSNGYYFLFLNHIRYPQRDYTDAAVVYWTKDLDHWDQNNKAIVIDASVSSWAKGAIGMPTVVKVDSSKLAVFYDGCVGTGTGHLGRSIGLTYVDLPLQPPILNKHRTSLYVTADDSYELYVNGTLVGTDAAWNKAEKYSVFLQPGKNVVAIKATNAGGATGLLAEVCHNDEWVETDTTWKISTTNVAGWNTTTFDDSKWVKATVVSPYGSAPWNTFQGMPNITRANWIWSAQQTDVTVYFRYTINIPITKTVFGTVPVRTLCSPMLLAIDPKSAVMKVTSPGNFLLRVFNPSGRLLTEKRGSVTGQFSLSRNFRARGVYFVQLISGGNSIMRTFVPYN